MFRLPIAVLVGLFAAVGGNAVIDTSPRVPTRRNGKHRGSPHRANTGAAAIKRAARKRRNIRRNASKRRGVR